MCEVAAHLTDHVLPHVPARQWVLSVPTRLRPYLGTETRSKISMGAGLWGPSSPRPFRFQAINPKATPGQGQL